MKISNPPVRYHGGKWRIAKWIISHFPPHVAYVEPFCGGASILFRKKPSTIEVINDLNGDVVNFFKILRTRTDEILKAIELTPFSRAEYELSYQLCDDELERARRFYVRNRQSFGSGEGKYRSGWRFQRNNNRNASIINEWNKIDYLMPTAKRLKEVSIECDDAKNIIERYDQSSTLFYVDPPYVMSARYDANREVYSNEMTDEQHRELADLLRNIDGMAIVSGYRTDLYDEIYAGWNRIEKGATTNGNKQRVECLWISPNAQALDHYPLFSQGGISR